VGRASRAVFGITAASLLAAAVTLALPGDFRLRHALRIANLPDISASELNDRAWLLATEPRPSSEALAVALQLAERAVAQTERRDATILDTLAEVQFQRGDPERAILIIDEAIAREPEQAYYREQRRRFLGERGRDDRPDPPTPPLPWDEPPVREMPVVRDDGVTV
jgi:hypothetical protein